ncbi:hypothetical protein amb2043 [Paramagnetospirillum magneticum AMB-1]|uniref:Probable ATP-binding protein BrxC alpha-helical domain-containing protein n=1 Tax=Paramagnetospirillum magneticum (strain ATCC 700264 / AMB-1) TaxID=342108 RepID=Q2W5M8_PARM1|nr:hypothetical protein amb2043 [Paramagnetospirillum magneticum AMB-1]
MVLLVARLVVAGELSMSMDGALLTRDKIFEQVKTPNKWRSIIVIKRQTVDAALLQQSRNLGKSVFSKMGPDGEDALYGFLREQCEKWQANLSGYLKLAETGKYPGKDAIDAGLKLLKLILAEKDSYGFIQKFVTLKAEFQNLSDDVSDLDTFYGTQQPVWELLGRKYAEFVVNRKELDHNPDAAAALHQMESILGHAAPYPLIKDISGLVSKVTAINDALVVKRRSHALEKIDQHVSEVKEALDHIAAPPDLRNRCLKELQKLRQIAETQTSIAHIHQAVTDAIEAKDDALDVIDRYVPPKPAAPTPPPVTPGTGGAEPTKTKAEPPPPIFKKPRVVRPAEMKSGYLKTQADVDAFLGKLRKELEAALAAEEPIEIR